MGTIKDKNSMDLTEAEDHFDIWQNQYNIVKLKNKIKFKKKNKKKEHSHNPKEMHIFTKICYFSSY